MNQMMMMMRGSNIPIVQVLENARYRVFDMPRAKAEELYAESMFDDFGIPSNVTT